MADIEGFGLAIYNENSGFCRIESDFMKPTDPNFTIVGQSFYLEDGILGLTIINKGKFLIQRKLFRSLYKFIALYVVCKKFKPTVKLILESYHFHFLLIYSYTYLYLANSKK